MCGLVGVIGLGTPVKITDPALIRMRDTLVHRGPDDAGFWRCPWAAIGHRRLSIIAPGPTGHQPMLSPSGRYVLAYNGELYNDSEVRQQLGREGVRCRTDCDTETVLLSLAHWGTDALKKLRGMYAFVFIDRDLRRVVLSRDPLGVKPLYIARTASKQLVFGSEPPAVLAHPEITPEPNWEVVSAYLTTIRPTLGSSTMFRGIETLLPGETRVYDARSNSPHETLDWWSDQSEISESSAQDTSGVIEESVRKHLRSDVPICSLLSGGLDSAIVSVVANEHVDSLETYCAGARSEGFDDDFVHARSMSAVLGTAHHEIEIDQTYFADQWASMVARIGLPMSTPNEVAIYAVACSLHSAGSVVTLSGEGADELFGGYEPPLHAAAEHVASLNGRRDIDGGLFQLRSNSWIATDVKDRVMRDQAWSRAGRDGAMIEIYRSAFDSLRASAPTDSPLQAHLRFHRRMNLPNLLRRFDSATMLASVEGRTPFADVEVAKFAEALPMWDKFVDGDPAETKKALRSGFASRLPASIASRPKASFPLPFQDWVGAHASVLRTSQLAQELFNTEALQTVSAAPEALWPMAWPMINIALWGERWWGRGVVEPNGTASRLQRP